MRAAAIHVTIRDLIWETLYLPLAALVGSTATLLNRFQFMTVRQYLSLVFTALIALLVVLTLWT
jgi:hydrogenase-4 component B